MTGANVLVGVATTVIPRPHRSADRWVSRPSRFYCMMARAAAEQGATLILFSPADANFENRRVKGYAPVAADQAFGVWKRIDTRLPDVIYENVFVHLAIAGKAHGLRQGAKRCAIPLFNPSFPSKWQLHRWLQKHELRKHLPKTETHQSAAKTVSLIDEWGSAYIKPIGGYGGLGVTRVERLNADRYRLSTDRAGKQGGKSRLELSRGALVQTLRRRIHRPHIVQQQIPLVMLKERKLDFRVVVQRSREGQWQVTGVVPKMAAKDGVVTNIIAGGERLTLAACRQMARQEDKTLNTDALERLALDLSNWLTHRIPYVGIIGYDLALDEQGHAWLIEANPKPARTLLSGAMLHRSARHCAEFAVYLANQRRGKGRREG